MIKTNKQPIDLSNYSFSSEQLSPKEINELKNVEEWKITVKEYSSSYFEKVTQELIFSLLKDFKVYLVYLESFPQAKSRMRTFKKMFYNKKNEFGKNNLFELEIDLEDNNSILSGIVQLNEKNIKNSLNQINSNFSFGLAVQKNKRSFPYNKEKFLLELKEITQKERKSSKINILKGIAKILNENTRVSATAMRGLPLVPCRAPRASGCEPFELEPEP